MTTPRYEVMLDKRADKAVAKLDKPVRRRIQTALLRLADDPRPPGVSALRGHKKLLRIRVGDYRIVYTVEDSVLLVLVLDVLNRHNVYRSGVHRLL